MKLKLKTRYLISILSAIVITIVVLTAAVLIQFRATIINATASTSKLTQNNLLNQLEKRAKLMALFLSEELVNSLYHYNMDDMYRTCSAARKQKNVDYVYVFDPNGRILNDGTPKNLFLDKVLTDMTSKNAVDARRTLIQTSGDTLDVATPIKLQNEIIGGVRVGLSTEEIHTEIQKMIAALKGISDKGLKQIWLMVILTATLLSFSGIALGAFLAKRLSHPISYLANITEQIGSGQYDINIPIQRSDEIGDLSNAFRKMANDLQHTTVSKAYVDNIIQHMIDLLIVVDTGGKIQTVNKAVCDILNYSEQKLVGSDISHIVEMQDVLGNLSLETFINKGAVANHEAVFRAKNGIAIPVLLSSSIISVKDKITGIIVIANDITHIKETEREKKRLELQLQQAQKMEALGTLAGGVAHDLNNILSGIISYPELLLMDIQPDDPLRQPLLTIKESGEKAATIVQDLLTLARRGVAVTETVSLNQIIDEYINSPEYKKLISFHPEIRVQMDLADNLLNIKGSPVHLSKACMNLISNAAEAIPSEGEIIISTYNQYIDKPIKGYDDIEEGDYVVFTISDSGVGIPSKDIDRIFEPFYTKKTMGKSGTGLGMAVVWGTIKDHRGYIDIQSMEGQGTTFKLYFPATREALSAQQSDVSLDFLNGHGKTVLIIDDVRQQQEIATRMLTKLGYLVASVSSGEEALEFLKSNPVDILVLDMIMAPGIDGLETYKRIIAFHPGQKAVIASGFSETNSVKAAQRLGAGIYVKKPYTLEEIGMALKNELAQK